MRAHVAYAAPRSVRRMADAEWQAKMELIENCKHCGQCMKKCPYTLNTPELLRKNLEDYRTFLK